MEREIELNNIYRIGKYSEKKIRPIVARFNNFKDRQDIRSRAPKFLNGKSYGVNEYFPPEVVKSRRELIPIHKEARKLKLKSVLRRDKLFIEGEPFDKAKHAYLIQRARAEASTGTERGDNAGQ